MFIKFRYTFSEKDDLTDENIKSIIKLLLDDSKIFKWDYIDYYTIGYEEKNKLGEPTHPHFHFHFSTTEMDIAPTRDRFRKFIKKIGETRTRAELYCMKEADVKDLHDFFRYVWKQDHPITSKLKYNLPEDFDCNTQREIAIDEYNKSCTYNRKQQDKANAPSTYDKLEIYLDENLKNKTKKDISLCVIAYYKQQKLSCNFSTMMGYVNTYRLLNNLMTDQEALDLMYKKE